jgi:hypothetical protein
VNRVRWLILVLGPLPIVGSSWAVSEWFKSEPPAVVKRNRVLPDKAAVHAVSVEPQPTRSVDEALSGKVHETARSLKASLGDECQVVVCSPFVLGGDLTTDELDRLYDETVAPAVRAMYVSYFESPPSEPITVLLFRTEDSYNRYCDLLFDDRGISIYGYYKPSRRTLVLNIGTGNGTLMHELTHALVDFDFPSLPDWLNEGLASLHEQSRFRSGLGGPWIEGLVNWRLAGLQEVVRKGQLGSLAELMANPKFRGPGEGTNYAQARYFCLYLQQQGLLARYYRAFRGNRENDPCGFDTLRSVIGEAALARLDGDFQRWVLELNDGS